MKKILSGVLGVTMVVAVVVGTARAVFTSSATVGGVTFATGNATLNVWDGDSYESNWAIPNYFSNMYPGFSTNKDLWFKNNSTSPIALSLFGKINAGASGEWAGLKNVVQVAVNAADGSESTGWHTLNDWYTTGYSLPGSAIANGTERLYKFYVQVPSTYGNEIANMNLSGIVFNFTGTQQ